MSGDLNELGFGLEFNLPGEWVTYIDELSALEIVYPLNLKELYQHPGSTVYLLKKRTGEAITKVDTSKELQNK